MTRRFQIMLPLKKTRKKANIEYGYDKNKNQNSLRINMRKCRHKTALVYRNCVYVLVGSKKLYSI